jgi:hypothetical protein
MKSFYFYKIEKRGLTYFLYGGFLLVLQLHPTNKTDLHDIAEILLKVALNTINKPTKQPNFKLIILMTQISIGIRRPDVTPRKENTPCVTTITGNSSFYYLYLSVFLTNIQNSSPLKVYRNIKLHFTN